jgi:hypothetical protein
MNASEGRNTCSAIASKASFCVAVASNLTENRHRTMHLEQSHGSSTQIDGVDAHGAHPDSSAVFLSVVEESGVESTETVVNVLVVLGVANVAVLLLLLVVVVVVPTTAAVVVRDVVGAATVVGTIGPCLSLYPGP